MKTSFDYAKYKAYLNSPQWSHKKDLIWNRSKGKCERCASAWGHDVHHIHYDNLYNEKLIDLLLLCRPCHEFVHRKSKFDPNAIPTIDELEKMVAAL